jgi:uncharacterized protein YkwD
MTLLNRRMRYIKFIFIFCLLISAKFPESDYRLQNSNEDFSQLEKNILDLINRQRQSIGKSELQVNELIKKVALVHTENMAIGKIPLSHDGFNERADNLLDELNGSSAAENVAWGHPTAKLVVKGWLESKDHRVNIEGDYDLTGIGIARGKDGELYYTQIFIKTVK